MLRHLYIQNYALIAEQEINFGGGLTVLTGETGAGKSIILGALGLVMGDRADAHAVAQGQNKCVIEARFDISGYDLEDFFSVNDLDFDTLCIVRREVTAQGKSRAFVNDSPVTLAVLRQLTLRLIDIHSQHENLLLRSDDFQLRFVDQMAEDGDLLSQYRTAYTAWQDLQQQLLTAKQTAEQAAKDRDYLQYQYDQLSGANLRQGELQDAEQEYHVLVHSQDIKTLSARLSQILSDGEYSVLQSLSAALPDIRQMAQYMPQTQQLSDRIHSAIIEIKDIASDIERVSDETDYDPQRQQMLSDRIDTINTLLSKHHLNSEQELIDLRDALEQQLNHIDNIGDDIERLTAQTEAAKKQAEALADRLTKVRTEQLKPIADTLTANMAQLGIAHPNIRLDIASTALTISGQDKITLLFSANLNQEPQPASQVASGGEIARLMLCVKALAAQKQGLPTVIFDEIDTGISGTVAGRVGQVMQQMARSRQVIAITHLPQIAAKADNHLRVYKQDTNNTTQTHIEPLDAEARVLEVATMLSGTPPTTAAQQAARELLS